MLKLILTLLISTNFSCSLHWFIECSEHEIIMVYRKKKHQSFSATDTDLGTFFFDGRKVYNLLREYLTGFTKWVNPAQHHT